MALSGNIELWEGVELYNAYCKILRVMFIIKRNAVLIAIGIYKEKPKTKDKDSIQTFHYECSGEDFNKYFSQWVLKQEGKEPILQAYSWLKTFKPYSEMIGV